MSSSATAAGPFPVEWFLGRGLDPSAGAEIIRSRVYRPTPASPPISLTPPVEWEGTANRGDRNWRMQLQAWTPFHRSMPFFDFTDQKREVLDPFLDVVADWWARYGGDPDDVVTSRMPDSYAWYDMSAGYRALVTAFFLNRIAYHRPAVEASRLRLLHAVAEKHVRHLSAPETFSLNNHGLWQAHGLMALVQVLGAERFPAERDYAFDRMAELVKAQFDDNGVHQEHSPAYHLYALVIVETIVATGWYRDREVITERARIAREATKWLVDPRKRCFCIGDSTLGRHQRVEFPSGERTDAEPCGFVTSAFDSSGYAVARSDWGAPPKSACALFLMGMYHSTVHKHRDCLSFEWFDRGRRLICDGGTYGYTAGKYRNYALSSRAHNSVVIEGFDILKMRPYGSAIDEVTRLEGSTCRLAGSLLYPAVEHRRTLYLRPGRWVIVDDRLRFERAREFVQLFHCAPDLHLASRDDNTVKLRGTDGTRLRVQTLDDDLELQVHRGDEEEMQGFVAEHTNRMEPAVAIGFRGHGDRARILTALSLGGPERREALGFARGL